MDPRAEKTASNELHRELVPLAEAAAVAYHIITENPSPLRDPRELDEVRCLVAIALSTVAPILKNGTTEPIGPAQIREQLFAPLSNRPAGQDASTQFTGLHIRRGDLIRAVEALKDAHISFGRAQVLQALKKTGLTDYVRQRTEWFRPA